MWAEGIRYIVCRLAQVQQVEVDVKGIPLGLVTEAPPLARQLFQRLGVRPPPRLEKLG